MDALDAVGDRLGTGGRVAAALFGGVAAVWGLFAVGAAVWYGALPPGSFLALLVLTVLVVALVAPTPEQDSVPEPHPAWQRELAEGEDTDGPRDDADGTRRESRR
jgi:hypothetical protein